MGDTNIAPTLFDHTLPPSASPTWLPPGEYPCSTAVERKSWNEFVVGDWLVDTFRHLYPRAQNVVSWAPDIVSRLKNEGLRIDQIWCSTDLIP